MNGGVELFKAVTVYWKRRYLSRIEIQLCNI